MNKKILISVTNRSSYNKVRTIVSNLPQDIEPTFLLSNSINIYRFGNIGELIKANFPKVRFLTAHIAVEGDDIYKMSKSVGLGIVEVSTLLANEKFDAVLSVADRFETMAIAISASYANIPLIHLQGGEQTGTIDNKVRNSISQLADIHFPCTDLAKLRLTRMCDDRSIWNYGCPSMDLFCMGNLQKVRDGHAGTMCLEDLVSDISHTINNTGTGDIINIEKPYVIVMLHADTTDELFCEKMYHLRDALNHIGMQEIVFWNNIDPGGDVIAKMWRERQHIMSDKATRIRYIRHLQPEDFGDALYLSSCIVGNSSAGIREASFLGTPSVNIGDRQHGRECAENCVSVPFSKTAIADAIGFSVDKLSKKPSDLYGSGHAGRDIAKRISDVLWDR